MSACITTTTNDLDPIVSDSTASVADLAATVDVGDSLANSTTTACLTTQTSSGSSGSSGGSEETSPRAVDDDPEPSCSRVALFATAAQHVVLAAATSSATATTLDDDVSVLSAAAVNDDSSSGGDVNDVSVEDDGVDRLSPSETNAGVAVVGVNSIDGEGHVAAASVSSSSPSRLSSFQVREAAEPVIVVDDEDAVMVEQPVSDDDRNVVDVEGEDGVNQLVTNAPGTAAGGQDGGGSRSPSALFPYSRRRRLPRPPNAGDSDEGVGHSGAEDANDDSVDIVIEEQYEEFEDEDVDVEISGEDDDDDESSVVELDDEEEVEEEEEEEIIADRGQLPKVLKMASAAGTVRVEELASTVCRKLFRDEVGVAGTSKVGPSGDSGAGWRGGEVSGSRRSDNGGDGSSHGSKSHRDKMKRKPTLDSKDYLLGKKPCLTGSDGEECVSLSFISMADTNDKIGAVVATTSTHNHKKRIPTKENPPPELAPWLSTFQCWSNAERLMALDHLIDMCDPTQVRHMMSVIEPQFQRDFISLLPKELALYVLSFLEPKDLLKAAQTCCYWRVLAEDNLLWREKCREAGIHEIRENPHKKRPKVCPIPSPWKAAYMRQHNIEMNWRFRPIRPPKVLKGHDDHVITCLQFCGTRIVSGSDDNTLKVWSATTGKCLKTLVGHTGGVWSSQMAGSIIVSGSTDRTLKVWNAETGQCVHTLYGHTSTVRCMHLHESKVVSGSRDATLRMWDIESGHCLHVLVGHVAAVRCVQYDGRLVVSGAYDYVVKVWNPEREECLHTLQGHTNRVYSLQFDGVHVVSGSLDTSIRVWDVETGACKHTLMGHQSLTSGMELKNNILVSGNADSTVKVWDITTGQCLQTLSGVHKHNSAVTCLQFNSKFVITSSDDGTVKLWDLKTGEFVRNLVALDSGGSGGVVWRIRASPTKLVCAVGSRNGTEETKLLVLDFDAITAVGGVEHSSGMTVATIK